MKNEKQYFALRQDIFEYSAWVAYVIRWSNMGKESFYVIVYKVAIREHSVCERRLLFFFFFVLLSWMPVVLDCWCVSCCFHILLCGSEFAEEWICSHFQYIKYFLSVFFSHSVCSINVSTSRKCVIIIISAFFLCEFYLCSPTSIIWLWAYVIHTSWTEYGIKQTIFQIETRACGNYVITVSTFESFWGRVLVARECHL